MASPSKMFLEMAMLLHRMAFSFMHHPLTSTWETTFALQVMWTNIMA